MVDCVSVGAGSNPVDHPNIMKKVDQEYEDKKELVEHINAFLVECEFTHAEWNGEQLICYTVNGKAWDRYSLLNYYGVKADWIGLEDRLEDLFDPKLAPVQFIRTTR